MLGQRQAAKAAELLGKWVEEQPADAEARFWFGVSLHAAGRVDEALAQHKKAAESKAWRGRALFGVARAHARRGEGDAAFAALSKAREAGFSDRAQMYAVADFAKLRGDARFAKALPPLRVGKDLFVEKVRIVHDFLGEAAGDQFGWVARRIGDVDGDGVVDFATSAPTKRIGKLAAAGRVYVYSSKTGKKLWSFDGKSAGARLGNGLAGCGDVDGDGVPDVIAGAPGAARVYVLGGASGKPLLELEGKRGTSFGLKVCALDDCDGDGRPELCVGAPAADLVHVYGHDGKERYVIAAPEAAKGGRFGNALDGYVTATTGMAMPAVIEPGGDAPRARLLAVGASRAGGSGRVYVYRVDKSGAKFAFEIKGDATSRNLGQYFVAILRDCDGDGHEDVYASDWNNNGPAPAAGRVFVHSGKSGKLILTLSGKQRGEGFGTSMSQAGDVNGDGISDFIVGAWQHRSAARSGGRCTLHSGSDGKILATYTCRQAGDTFGFDAQGIGDIDGDGAIDFVCTSGWSPVHGARTGRVLIIAGPKLTK